MIATILGGVGLFLLGMVLLTDGLKTAAGGALRTVLGRFAGGTPRALLSGAALTALVQSSSATVLTTIGFVSAGLLTLRQALGIIFGATVGTTSTGWIVSLLGLKLSIGAVALPLVGVGALVRLLSRGRLAAAGLALAGFGLIFVGIDVLQQGMSSLSDRLAPDALPSARLGGRLLLLAAGAAMTVVMQSSSAAVATTLTALHAGTLSLEQAASLVVGHHVGTTATAALATIGASVTARRAALAHIILNTTTGLIAFLVVPAYASLEPHVAAWLGSSEPEMMIAAFHTGFTLLGVILFAPAIPSFARLVERLLPEPGGSLTRRLDATVAEVPQVAVEAARLTVMAVAEEAAAVLQLALAEPRRSRLPVSRLDAANSALHETRRFLAGVRTTPHGDEYARHLSVHHAIDHLARLLERLQHHTPERPTDDDSFRALCSRTAALMLEVRTWLRTGEGAHPAELCRSASDEIARHRREQREATLERTATGELDPDLADERLATMRWLDSSVYHTWRAVHHLAAPDAVAAARTPGG
jgi:phosphate:Na+ symporter